MAHLHAARNDHGVGLLVKGTQVWSVRRNSDACTTKRSSLVQDGLAARHHLDAAQCIVRKASHCQVVVCPDPQKRGLVILVSGIVFEAVQRYRSSLQAQPGKGRKCRASCLVCGFPGALF
jgi:hypothetical protein